MPRKRVAQMAFETRNGKRYYYSSFREHGRVRKRYHGGGEAGQLAADAFEARKAERLRQRELERAEVTKLTAAHQHLRDVDNDLKDMIRALLIAGGLYYHHGHWRIRHEFGKSRQGLRKYRKERAPGSSRAGECR